MGLIIDMKTKRVINQPLKQSMFVEVFDITMFLLRTAFFVSFLAFRFSLI